MHPGNKSCFDGVVDGAPFPPSLAAFLATLGTGSLLLQSPGLEKHEEVHIFRVPFSPYVVIKIWVVDGARTHNLRDHNPMLCQLSYYHHVHHVTALLYPVICAKSTGGTAKPHTPTNTPTGWRVCGCVSVCVRGRGLEPPRDCSHKPLKLARLPVSPPARFGY